MCVELAFSGLIWVLNAQNICVELDCFDVIIIYAYILYV